MKNVLSLLVFSLFCAWGATAQTDDSKVEYGIGSMYSDDYAGRQTAYGDTYDPKKLTAAHKRHAYGTMLRVTRLDNKKSVVVKVTDKGPFIKGRVVEISGAAADKIDLSKDGFAEVKVEVVSRSSSTQSAPVATAEKVTPKSYDVEDPRPASTSSGSQREEPKSTVKEKETAKSGTTAKSEKSKSESSSKARLVGKDYSEYGLYKIQLQKPEAGDFGVQVASLSNYENVLKQVADLQAKWFDNILLSIEKGNSKPIYKIILGPFDDEDSAKNYQSSLSKKHKIKGFVVNLTEISY